MYSFNHWFYLVPISVMLSVLAGWATLGLSAQDRQTLFGSTQRLAERFSSASAAVMLFVIFVESNAGVVQLMRDIFVSAGTAGITIASFAAFVVTGLALFLIYLAAFVAGWRLRRKRQATLIKKKMDELWAIERDRLMEKPPWVTDKTVASR